MSSVLSNASSSSTASSCRSTTKPKSGEARSTFLNRDELAPEHQQQLDELYEKNKIPKGFRAKINSLLVNNPGWSTYTQNILASKLSEFVGNQATEYKNFRIRPDDFAECLAAEQFLASRLKPLRANSSASSRRSQSSASAQQRSPIDELENLIKLFGSNQLAIADSKAELLQKEIIAALNAAKMITNKFVSCMKHCRQADTFLALISGSTPDFNEKERQLIKCLEIVSVLTQTFIAMLNFMKSFVSDYASLGEFNTCIKQVAEKTLFLRSVPPVVKSEVTFNASVWLPALPSLVDKTQFFSVVQQTTQSMVFENFVDALLENTTLQPPDDAIAATFTIAQPRAAASAKNSKVFGVELTQHLIDYQGSQYSCPIINYSNFTVKKVTIEDGVKTSKSKSASAKYKECPAETEKLSHLLLSININLYGTCWTLRTHSLPLVLVTHVKQFCPAWRTLFWNYAFGSISNLSVPHEVPADVFFNALQQWFQAKSGFLLKDHHLKFLWECVCDASNVVTYASLWERPDKQRPIQVQFWPFFYKFTVEVIAKVEPLRQLWENNMLYGFATQGQAELLLTENPGYGLIRFCNSKAGAIVVMVSCRDQNSNVRVCSVRPMTVKQLDCFFLKLNDANVEKLWPEKNNLWKNAVGFIDSRAKLSTSDHYEPAYEAWVLPPMEKWSIMSLKSGQLPEAKTPDPHTMDVDQDPIKYFKSMNINEGTVDASTAPKT